ncbi:GDP-mannose 4,6-dehydratase [Leifsonia bigeumensis]|uniref:GDP-mannose 4,6-dehydratase n=1 Tax=Leifsonella bigeumensis TaxID=433643 RepID=A0ABP7FBF5_9MICO
MPLAFITGVTGQDGTYLARALLAEGVEVHGLVRPGSVAIVEPGVTVHEADIRDSGALQGLVADLKPDELYHLAGQSSVGASWEDPVGTVEQTGAPVAALLQAVERHSRQTRLVNASSAEIFGVAPAPQNESTPIAPVSPYGAAKALGYFLVSSFRERGVHASSAILYNHESPLRPERFVTRKITVAAARIARGLQETVTLGNLDASRDWGWAPDYVDAMRSAVRQPTPGDHVIGTGELHTVRDFVVAAFAAAGIDDWQPHVVTDDTFFRPVDPATQAADASRARDRLGWAPTIAFPELVERMVRSDLARIDESV